MQNVTLTTKHIHFRALMFTLILDEWSFQLFDESFPKIFKNTITHYIQLPIHFLSISYSINWVIVSALYIFITFLSWCLYPYSHLLYAIPFQIKKFFLQFKVAVSLIFKNLSVSPFVFEKLSKPNNWSGRTYWISSLVRISSNLLLIYPPRLKVAFVVMTSSVKVV